MSSVFELTRQSLACMPKGLKGSDYGMNLGAITNRNKELIGNMSRDDIMRLEYDITLHDFIKKSKCNINGIDELLYYLHNTSFLSPIMWIEGPAGPLFEKTGNISRIGALVKTDQQNHQFTCSAIVLENPFAAETIQLRKEQILDLWKKSTSLTRGLKRQVDKGLKDIYAYTKETNKMAIYLPFVSKISPNGIEITNRYSGHNQSDHLSFPALKQADDKNAAYEISKLLTYLFVALSSPTLGTAKQRRERLILPPTSNATNEKTSPGHRLLNPPRRIIDLTGIRPLPSAKKRIPKTTDDHADTPSQKKEPNAIIQVKQSRPVCHRKGPNAGEIWLKKDDNTPFFRRSHVRCICQPKNPLPKKTTVQVTASDDRMALRGDPQIGRAVIAPCHRIFSESSLANN